MDKVHEEVAQVEQGTLLVADKDVRLAVWLLVIVESARLLTELTR